jgi:hypothetical protein
MNKHGHPILGGVAGLFFGIFLGLFLLTSSVVELGSIVLTLLPIIGLVLGVAWGKWAPLGRAPASPPVAPPSERPAEV